MAITVRYQGQRETVNRADNVQVQLFQLNQ